MSGDVDTLRQMVIPIQAFSAENRHIFRDGSIYEGDIICLGCKLW